MSTILSLGELASTSKTKVKGLVKLDLFLIKGKMFS